MEKTEGPNGEELENQTPKVELGVPHRVRCQKENGNPSRFVEENSRTTDEHGLRCGPSDGENELTGEETMKWIAMCSKEKSSLSGLRNGTRHPEAGHT